MIKILLANERLWSLKNLISITYHIIGDYMLSKQFNSTSFLRTKKKNSKKHTLNIYIIIQDCSKKNQVSRSTITSIKTYLANVDYFALPLSSIRRSILARPATHRKRANRLFSFVQCIISNDSRLHMHSIYKEHIPLRTISLSLVYRFSSLSF